MLRHLFKIINIIILLFIFAKLSIAQENKINQKNASHPLMKANVSITLCNYTYVFNRIRIKINDWHESFWLSNINNINVRDYLNIKNDPNHDTRLNNNIIYILAQFRGEYGEKVKLGLIMLDNIHPSSKNDELLKSISADPYPMICFNSVDILTCPGGAIITKAPAKTIFWIYDAIGWEIHEDNVYNGILLEDKIIEETKYYIVILDNNKYGFDYGFISGEAGLEPYESYRNKYEHLLIIYKKAMKQINESDFRGALKTINEIDIANEQIDQYGIPIMEIKNDINKAIKTEEETAINMVLNKKCVFDNRRTIGALIDWANNVISKTAYDLTGLKSYDSGWRAEYEGYQNGNKIYTVIRSFGTSTKSNYVFRVDITTKNVTPVNNEAKEFFRKYSDIIKDVNSPWYHYRYNIKI